MKRILLAAVYLTTLLSTPAWSKGRLQNEDFKTEAEITAAGGTAAQLLNDSKIWMTSVVPAQKLSTAVTAGLIGGGGGNSGKNYLSNASFEGGATGWTITGATNAVNTSDFHDGAQSLTLTPTGAGSILQSVTPTTNLKGSNLESGLWIKTSKTDVQNCSYINAVEVECQNVPATGEWVYVPANAAGPAQGTSIGVKLKWASTGGSIIVDMGYTGGATNLTQIAQAKYVGKLKYAATALCDWQQSSGAGFQNMGVDTDCATPTTDGLIIPDTKIPAFKMNVTSGQIYKITTIAEFVNGNGTAMNQYRMSDGTDNTEVCTNVRSVSGVDIGQVATAICYYKPTTSGLKTIQFQSDANTVNASIAADRSDFIIEVEQLPSQSQLAVNSLQSDFGLTSFTPSFSCIGSPTGANFKYAKRGEKMFIIGRFTHSGGTGTCSFTLPNSLTANVSESGGTYNVVGYGTITSNNVALYALAQSGSGIISFGLSGPTSSGITPYSVTWSPEEVNFSMEVPINGWNESQRAPTLVGSVTTDGSFASRYDYALVSSGVVSNASSNWISCTNAAPSVCTFTTAYNTPPVCQVTAVGSSPLDRYATVDTATTTSITVSLQNYLQTVSLQGPYNSPFNITCSGPR